MSRPGGLGGGGLHGRGATGLFAGLGTEVTDTGLPVVGLPVVCHEPHSPIIALANGVPIIHTHSAEHGPKSFMFRDIGLGDWLFDHDATPASRITETLFAIRDDYRAAQARVAVAMDGVRDRMAGSMLVLRTLLNLPESKIQ